MFITYDLIGKKVLTRDNLLRTDRISSSFDNISVLLPETYDLEYVTNLSIEDACLIENFLLMSISYGDDQDYTYQFQKIFVPAAMKSYMTAAARKLMKPTKATLEKTLFDAEATLNGQPVYSRVDESPKFRIEGTTLSDYVSESMSSVEDKINGPRTGQVMVGFVVDQEGNTKDVRVVKSLAAAYDREAVRVVKGLPRWQPALIDGAPVNMRTAIIITFSGSR